MVDAIVSFAVERLGELLIQEGYFLRSVKNEVEWLKKELETMKSFLKDAEENEGADGRVRWWISQIRDVAYDSEDVIDTFILNVKVEGIPKTGFWASTVKKFPFRLNRQTDLYSIGKKIKALKEKLQDISSRRERYGIRNLGNVEEGMGGTIANRGELRRTASYADEEYVVGFEDDTAKLIDELFKEEPRRCVIAIWGMGGLGKTTLARKLYHHRDVASQFGHRAWVCVSQKYTIRDLLQRIIKSFKQERISQRDLELWEKMGVDDLKRYLRSFLKESKYLVVIDDVWEEEAWRLLGNAFPDNAKGSRVIVTIRNEVVARSIGERTYLHELQFLSPGESWILFCEKAFPDRSAIVVRSPDLETTGREMLQKCGGLPLAIIVLGGLLSRTAAAEWDKVKDCMWWNLKKNSTDIVQLLALSFNHLPYWLKPCFLYLGLYPEDFEIGTEKLIRLWVAEGFIQPGDDAEGFRQPEAETLEGVAEDWLKELISRSLIQVTRRSWMKVTACRVHDLLRDLAVEKAKELKFLHNYDGRINSTPSSNTAPSYRRQGAHTTSINRYVSVEFSNPCLRTLLFFDPDSEGSNIGQELTLIYRRFKLLRVLDLQSICIGLDGLPDAVGDLRHLRYLGLRKTELRTLPPSIVNLQALQTLDVLSGDLSVRLPDNICKLIQLRHLIGHFEGPLRVDQLTNLQTLKFVSIDDRDKINLENLINLRELHITFVYARESKEFTWDPIATLRNLRSLSVELSSPMYITSIQPLSKCEHLLQLVILGRIKILPEQMHDYLPNLKYLLLKDSELRQDPMPTLEKLPRLTVLDLSRNNLKKLTCTAKGFPRLEVLVLSQLPCLEELEVEEEAMPMLKGFQIDYCNNFTVPERLRSILGSNNLNRDWGWVLPRHTGNTEF